MTPLRRAPPALLLIAGLACALHQAPAPTPSDLRDLPRLARLLSAERLEVEVDWLPGCRPSARSLAGARDFLERYARPTRGVEVRLDEEISWTAPAAGVTGREAQRLAARHRRPVDPQGDPALYLLFVPRRDVQGGSSGHRGVAWVDLGMAVIASQTIREQSALALRGDEIERFVVQHELGHLLGLVSGDDHERGGHCTNPTCLMYHGLDARTAWAHWWRPFVGRLPRELDPACRADLERLRALAPPDGP